MSLKKSAFFIAAAFAAVCIFDFSIAKAKNNINQETKDASPQVTAAIIVPAAKETEKYDKNFYQQEILKYNDVILPFDSSDSNYISETLFVGDSNTEGLASFKHLSPNNVLGKHSMDIQGVSSNSYIVISEDIPETEEDETQTITMLQYLAMRQPKRIIFNFGTNNAGEKAVVDSFIKTYSDTLEQIELLCPNTQIVVAAVLPIAKNNNYPNIKQDVIDKFNIALAELCRDKGYGFLHYPEIFKDESTGYMNNDYISPDGLHLNGDGYRLLLNYAEQHQYN